MRWPFPSLNAFNEKGRGLRRKYVTEESRRHRIFIGFSNVNLVALRKLIADDFVNKGESVVIFNIGSGVKYPEAFTKASAAKLI